MPVSLSNSALDAALNNIVAVSRPIGLRSVEEPVVVVAAVPPTAAVVINTPILGLPPVPTAAKDIP
jgi:hypothetical protein